MNADGTPKTGLAIPASANIKVTPFSNMYVGVRYKANGTLQQKRATKNIETTFTAPSEVFNDTETAIYGASELSSIGDLAPLYCGSVNVSKATKLTKLKVGDAKSGYSNTNLTSLSVGTNKLLSVIDVRNCPNLTAPLALANCPNIEEIYATGTAITGVELPSSGYLKKIYLPNTITNLTLRNQTHIETFSCAGYTNLTTLRIENCVNVPIATIVNAATNLSRVRLLDVSLTCDDETLINKLMACGGLDETGNNTEKSVVTGSIHITSIKPSTLSAVQTYYPNLTVTYDTLLVEYTVTFKNWDGTVLDTQHVVKYGNAVDPVTSGRIQTPTKPMDAQYTYTYSGWSAALTNVAADRMIIAQYISTVRSYTIRFLNGSNVLQSSQVQYGQIPSYTGTNPTPASSNQIFSGWTPEISAVTGAQDYVAQFATLTVPEAVKTFAECSWTEIKAVAANGHKNASNQWCITRNGAEEVWWDIGDEKDITLSDGETITLQIYDFLHDDKTDGTKAPLTIGMKNLMATTAKMKSRSTNVGGWEESEMRTTTLPAVFNKLPSVLQAIICEVSKKASAGNKSTDVLMSADKLFLFSEVEVDGTTDTVYKDEGTKYPIFTTSASRLKSLANGTGIKDFWWTRSPVVRGTWGFCIVTNYTGYVDDNYGSSEPHGICFGFCI